MTATVRIGLIGAGRFGRLHLKVLAQIPGAETVALADIDSQALEEAANRFGIGPDGRYEDPLRLIEDPRVDAVDIVSDESTHGPLILHALRRGKHVIVEKPLCISAAEAEEIARASEESGKQVLVGNISRYSQPYRMIKRSIDAGKLGAVAAIRAKRNFSRSWFQAFGNRIHPVYESGVHELDLIVWYANARCVEVAAFERRVEGYRYPDLFSAILTFENGVVASLDSSWAVPAAAPRNLVETLELDGTIDAHIEVIGETGTAYYQLAHPGFGIWTPEEVLHPDTTLWPDEGNRVGGAIASELADFVEAIREERPSRTMPLADSVHVTRIADAIVRSAAAKTIVDLDGGESR
ncbi:Gfo/Idh/MocA family protein [Cohnella zeiphila]|uniref:Gfo/Idh/MocA family oxidoreductase n=1 Tax=Cohnella zeiphila TaxID=2761120 RepID=A0A7X0VV74_9BACL|nr:Gfo/Idh/MocA family oxidoreductase [Cohnella zeiphila]MBB6729608.1 Gfo/Idh/MocA family oxidoreductase [Cohnella zeiphila]